MSASTAPGSRSSGEILFLPWVIFLATAAGLAAALLGDGGWHVLAWLLLALPVAVIIKALI